MQFFVLFSVLSGLIGSTLLATVPAEPDRGETSIRPVLFEVPRPADRLIDRAAP